MSGVSSNDFESWLRTEGRRSHFHFYRASNVMQFGNILAIQDFMNPIFDIAFLYASAYPSRGY